MPLSIAVTTEEWKPLTGRKRQKAEDVLKRYKKKLNKSYKSGKLTKEQCSVKVNKREIELGLKPPANLNVQEQPPRIENENQEDEIDDEIASEETEDKTLEEDSPDEVEESKKPKKRRKALSIAVICIILVAFLLFSDIDGDGVIGVTELKNGINMFNSDTDDDGMPDGWELTYNLNPGADDSSGDPDNDNLTNFQEFKYETDPRNNDSDSDTLLDGFEIENGLDPTKNDLNDDIDNDGLTNIEEINYGTFPDKPDSDFDGLTDSEEKQYGTEPLVKDSDNDKFLDGVDPAPLDSNSPRVSRVNSSELTYLRSYSYELTVEIYFTPELLSVPSYVRQESPYTENSLGVQVENIKLEGNSITISTIEITKSASFSKENKRVELTAEIDISNSIDTAEKWEKEGIIEVRASFSTNTFLRSAEVPSRLELLKNEIDRDLEFIDYDTLTSTNYFNEKRRNKFFSWRLGVSISFDAYATSVRIDPKYNKANVDGQVWVARYFGSVDSERDEFISELADIYIQLGLTQYTDAEPSVVHKTGTAIIVWTIDFDFDIETTGSSPDTAEPGEFDDLPNFYPDAIPTDLSFYILSGEDTSVRVKVGEVNYDMGEYYTTFTQVDIIRGDDDDTVVGQGYYFGGLPISQNDLEDFLFGNYLPILESALETSQRGEILMDIPGFMERVMWE